MLSIFLSLSLFLIAQNGTPVESNFLTLARQDNARAVLCFNNLTSHRHQIRLCCSALGTPIIGMGIVAFMETFFFFLLNFIRLFIVSSEYKAIGDKLYETKTQLKSHQPTKQLGSSIKESIKEEKISESDIPFVSCYVSFPKYISQGIVHSSLSFSLLVSYFKLFFFFPNTHF
jgi:hypothetical protein